MTSDETNAATLNGHATDAVAEPLLSAATLVSETAKETDTRARNRPGAPLGNTNNWRTGRRTLRLGKLPKPLAHIEHDVARLRKAAYASLDERGVKVGLSVELAVQGACRHEQAALIAQRLLRTEWDKLSAIERINLANSIATSSEARDKKLAGLGFGLKAGDGAGHDSSYEAALAAADQAAMSNGDNAPDPTDDPE